MRIKFDVLEVESWHEFGSIMEIALVDVSFVEAELLNGGSRPSRDISRLLVIDLFREIRYMKIDGAKRSVLLNHKYVASEREEIRPTLVRCW
jgi:hypothetical protein